MIQNVYSIYDHGAGEYSPPFIAHNNTVALRNFKSFLESVPKHIGFDEFSLSFLCLFNSELGTFDLTLTPRRVDYTEQENEA